MNRHLRITSFFFVALLLAACSTPATPDAAPTEDSGEVEPVHLRVLAFNDFHGALEGPTGSVMIEGESIEAGGAEYFAAHIAAERGEADFTTVVAAGDLIGASPLISALFHDEPTIEVLGEAGIDLASVGNHEFDAGVDELLRIANGGCHPDEGCRDGYTYDGAPFQYLAANVRFRDSGETILPAYEIREYGGVKIAYVGMTLENTPQVVVPSAVKDVTFHNEVETVEALLPELEEQGVDSIIVVVHEGAAPTEELTDVNDCPSVEGRATGMASDMPPEVSVIISGHSHLAYICNFEDRLLTQAASSGRLITVIDLFINPVTGEIVDKTARQRPVTRDIEPNTDVAHLVAHYADLAGPLINEPVGRITADLPRGHRAAAGESPIGRLIADAQLEATAEEAGAQIAFMNPGGIRDALTYESNDHEEDGVVTYSHLHTVQPFANILISMTLTGQQLHELLEQQWREDSRPHLLAISNGFTYEWTDEAPVGERVNPSSIKLHGEVVDPEQSYRITVNNFMSDGGDGFSVLTEGTDRVGGVIDLDALATYVQRHSPIDPPQDVRAKQK